MATKVSACSSTSTTDLYYRQIITTNSSSQTLHDEHDDDDYANYEENSSEKPSIPLREKTTRKSDQTTLYRVKQYSVACWTKPAHLVTNP